jgi:23S rRNA (adenine2503-C2)-methyltransferase
MVRVQLPVRRPARDIARGRFDVWALKPDELQALLPGHSGAASFGELQRPWRWDSSGPALSAKVLGQLGPLALPTVRERRASSDGATKLLLELDHGSIECVHMPREVTHGKVTLCVSSQIGCAMACSFCATAQMGLRGQLSAGEIVAQVLVALRELGPRHPGELTLVFMGMGEPLHNWSRVARALQILQHPGGLGLSPRRITLSTSGLVPQIEKLAQFNERPLLAVSLNATTDELRRQLMPVAARHSLAELRAVLERFPLRPRERITVEYVLLAGVNDSLEDAARLSDYCATFRHHINLIPYNAPAGAAAQSSVPHFEPPSEAHIEAFGRAVLARRSTLLTVRRTRGRDVSGACGQLALTAGAAE